MTPARRNLLFTLILLAVAAGLFAVSRLVWLRPGSAGGGPVAVLQYGEPAQTMCIPLAEDADLDVDTGFYTIHLQVREGSIAFVDSPCPDHLCEGFGQLKGIGDWAACLPARASLTIEEEKP